MVYRTPLMHAHPSSAETTDQSPQIWAAAPAWPWRPSNLDESLATDPVVYKSRWVHKLNEDNFYMKIIDLDEIYNFLVLSFFIWSR